MKNFRIVVTALLVALLAAVCVSAATVSYDLVAYDEEANQWEVTFTYNLGLDEESDEYANAVVGTYTTYFTFNPEKLVLTDTNYDAVTDYATAKGAPVYFYPTKNGRNDYTYSLTDAKEKTWTVLDNGNVQGYLTAYTQETVFEPNGTTVLSVAFSLAEGVTKEDIYKSTVGNILCLFNKHDVISYIPTVGGKELDVKIIMCKRCAKELSRKKIYK